MDYLSGQGRLLLAERNSAGMPGTFRWVGDVNPFEVGASQDRVTVNESYTGQRGVALDLGRNLTVNLSATLKQLDAAMANVKLLTLGEDAVQATGSVTSEAISPASGTLAVGDIFMLGAFDVSAVVIKDSTGSPKTLTLGTNYTLNAKAGQIEIIDATTGGPFVLPLVADYTKADASAVKLYNTASVEYWVRFEGVNTAVSGNPVVVADFYKWRPSPASQLALINDEVAEFPIEGSILIDSGKSASGPFGQYGRLITF